jgi:hypothetical protein
MIKYFLTGAGVLAVAASGAVLTNLGDLDDPGVSKEGLVLLNSSASRADLIYNDQTYDYAYCTNGLSIYGAANYESADDFVPEDDYVTVQEVVIWLSAHNVNLRCDFFEGSSSGPGDAPPADFFNEEVSFGVITWEVTVDYLFGYPIVKATVPISDCELSDGDYYWLGFQNTTGGNTFWWAFDHGTMGGPYWEGTYFYYVSYWTDGSSVFGSSYDEFYELWGTIGPPDEEDPTVTDMYPVDGDYPSGVPPNKNTAGCHWQDGDPDTNKGIDVEASTFDIYDPDMGLVLGTLVIDDADLWDVIVDFEAEDPFEEGATYTVETETYDLAGNGPVTETWTFDVGYTNVVERSFGAIKANFR